jgi:homoserine O-acetyltransferase
MKRLITLFIYILIFSQIVYSQSDLNLVDIGTFKLSSGDVIKDCKIGYRIFGKINDTKSNIIIYPTWFGGTSAEIGSLVGKHKFIDTTKYCIIAIDALANGISSSPSNYDSTYPEITIKDMVNAEYYLLTEKLKINHVFAAIGGSMGSMQVLEFAVDYPNFMDKVVAYVTSPKMTSYDLLWMNTQFELIKEGRKYGMNDREIKRLSDMISALISRTPEYVVQNTKVENFPEYLASFDKEPSKIFTIDDYVAQLKAISKFDLSENFNGSMEEAASKIKAELFIIVNQKDMLVNPTEALKFADMTKARKLILNDICGHLAVSCELERCSKEIEDFLNN